MPPVPEDVHIAASASFQVHCFAQNIIGVASVPYPQVGVRHPAWCEPSGKAALSAPSLLACPLSVYGGSAEPVALEWACYCLIGHRVFSRLVHGQIVCHAPVGGLAFKADLESLGIGERVIRSEVESVAAPIVIQGYHLHGQQARAAPGIGDTWPFAVHPRAWGMNQTAQPCGDGQILVCTVARGRQPAETAEDGVLDFL